MASILGELKRRNVVRVGIAYVVFGWLLAQVADLAFGAFRAPPWLLQAFLVMLLLGFPIALILAWAFEITLEGVTREDNVEPTGSAGRVTGRRLDFVIIGVLAVAIVVFAFERFVLLPNRIQSTNSAAEVAETVVRESIAVLPFVNMSSDPEQEYFSDGLSEEILNLLARIPELKVIGRTSSFAFKGKNEDLRIIGRLLGVNTVLEGSVRKSGDRIRISAQLIDATDASQIWSETYDRLMTDIFEIQDDVAAAIIDAMQIHVGVNPTRGNPTTKSNAYSLFLRAMALRNEFRWQDAEQSLRDAIRLDPAFAEAYELLAGIYWGQAGGVLEAAEAQQLMGEAAARALAIVPDLVLAKALFRSGDLANFSLHEEIKAFEQAARAQPDNLQILGTLGFNLGKAGYLQEALQIAERLADLDPLSPHALGRLYASLVAVGRTDEAFVALNRLGQLEFDGKDWFLICIDLSNIGFTDSIIPALLSHTANP